MSKKLIVAAIVAVMAFGSLAMATESRLETTGNQGLYMMDDTNIFTNPATAAYYSGMARLHMGGVDGGDYYAYAGGTMTVMDALTVGLFFARNPGYEEGGIGWITNDAITSPGSSGPISGGPVFVDVWGLAGLGDPPPNIAPDWMNPFDVILAYQMGDLAVGISYYLANGKVYYEDDIPGDEDDTLTYEGKSRLHSIKVGMSYKMGNIQPEAWFNYSPYTINSSLDYDDDAGADYTADQELKGNKFALGGRLFYNMNDNLAIVPAVAWEYVTGDVSIDTDDDLDLSSLGFGDATEEDLGQEYTINSIVGGVSVQYTANKLFLITSAALRYSRATLDLSIDHDDVDNWESTGSLKSKAFPEVAMGIEYQAFEWCYLRGGLKTTTIWASSTDLYEESTDHDDIADDSLLQTVQSTTANVGVGLVFGNLMIDATFGNFVLVNEDGGSLGEGPNLFSHLDAKYMFK